MSHYYSITTQKEFQMCMVLEMALMPKMKKKITLAPGWFKQTEDSVMITYYYSGWDKPRFITFERGEDIADFLLEIGKITRYEGYGSNVRMYYEKVLNNSFKWVETELEWRKIGKVFFDTDAITLAAKHEYEVMGGGLGLRTYRPKAKCIDFTTHQQAA